MADYDAAAKAAEVAQGCTCGWYRVCDGVLHVIWRRIGSVDCPRHGLAVRLAERAQPDPGMKSRDQVVRAAAVAKPAVPVDDDALLGMESGWRHGPRQLPRPEPVIDISEAPRGAVTEAVAGASGDCAHGVPGHLLCGACEPEAFTGRPVEALRGQQHAGATTESELIGTLVARGSRYGAFPPNARISQALKQVMADTPNWLMMRDAQREALELIALKVSRILSGDPDYADNWHDIAGYATLAEREIEERGA